MKRLRNLRTWRCLWSAMLLWGLGAATVQAATPGATNSKQARDEAVRSIAWDKLDPALRMQVQGTINKCSIYRRMPLRVNDCDPQMYRFLVEHPDVVVNIWKVMGISRVTLNELSPGEYSANDGAGTTAQVRLVRLSHDTHLIYGEGTYEGPLFEKPIAARCVLVLKSGFVRETNGRDYVTSRMDAFFQIEHAGFEFLAKTFSPLIAKSSDYNFTETAAFVSNVSRTSELNPEGMERLARKLEDISEETREKFVVVSNEVADRGAERTAANPPQRRAVKASAQAVRK